MSAWPDGPRRLERLERLTGDASNRIYVRVTLPAGAPKPTVMAMIMPLDPAGSEEFGAAGQRSGELPFITMARWLTDRGVPVPTLYHWAERERVLLLEDLGDQTLERALSEGDRRDCYRAAVDLLLDFQVRTDRPDDPIVAGRPPMDRSVLAWELEHYVEWRLETDLGHGPGPWKEALLAALEPLVAALSELPVRLIHRDFQSRNLMCGRPGRYRIIDFQDAMRGPYVYDLVALLRDSYVTLSEAEVDELVERYALGARERELLDWDPDRVRRDFDLMTVQRKLKDTGRFVFIDRVKDNASFLPYRAPSMTYVRAALDRLADFSELRALIGELDPP